MRRYKRRDYAIVLLLMGVPVLLGAMPFLRELADRVALIEQFLNGPGASPVVVDANGETVGTVVGLDYFSDSFFYASVLVDRFRPRHLRVYSRLFERPRFLASDSLLRE